VVGSPAGERDVTANRYIVAGRVQGVGYRYFVLQQAEALGVTGFTRNLADGSVEVVAEGTEDLLDKLGERLREGPAFSSVTGLECEPVAPRGDSGFQIR
jgi:acylphosphatase